MIMIVFGKSFAGLLFVCVFLQIIADKKYYSFLSLIALNNSSPLLKPIPKPIAKPKDAPMIARTFTIPQKDTLSVNKDNKTYHIGECSETNTAPTIASTIASIGALIILRMRFLLIVATSRE